MNSGNLKFSSVKLNEVGDLKALATTIWLQNYQKMISAKQIDYMLDWMYSENRIKEEIDKAENWFWLMVENDRVGYIHFYPKEEAMFVSKIYLHNNWQGRGYASEAMDFIKQKAQEIDLKELQLTVNKTNAKAIAFYTKYGFKIREEKVFDIGNGFVMDDYIMTYAL